MKKFGVIRTDTLLGISVTSHVGSSESGQTSAERPKALCRAEIVGRRTLPTVEMCSKFGGGMPGTIGNWTEKSEKQDENRNRDETVS